MGWMTGMPVSCIRRARLTDKAWLAKKITPPDGRATGCSGKS